MQEENCFPTQQFRYLVEAVNLASRRQPTHQLHDRLFVGMVGNAGSGSLILEWAPYFFSSCTALVIRGGNGRCIAVKQCDVLRFALWLTRQLLVLHDMDKLGKVE